MYIDDDKEKVSIAFYFVSMEFGSVLAVIYNLIATKKSVNNFIIILNDSMRKVEIEFTINQYSVGWLILIKMYHNSLVAHLVQFQRIYFFFVYFELL